MLFNLPFSSIEFLISEGQEERKSTQHFSKATNTPAKQPEEASFGRLHILAAMDLKQLPHTTSNPHFMAVDPSSQQRLNFVCCVTIKRRATRFNEEEQPVLVAHEMISCTQDFDQSQALHS